MDRKHAQRVLEHLQTVGPGQSDLIPAHRIGVVARHQGKQFLRNAAMSGVTDRLARGGAGKVFHTKAHARKKGEKYYTPAWVTRCLLRQVHLPDPTHVWEPAAGDGKIVDALRSVFGVYVYGSDVAPDRTDILPFDFLTAAHAVVRCDIIISNPPFGTGGRLAFQFCWHALRLMERRKGKVAMLLRDDFDSAKGRKALFRDHPAFDMKIVITDRIRWTNLPQDAKKGPSGSHAWFIWDWSRDMTQHTALVYESADEDPLEAVTK